MSKKPPTGYGLTALQLRLVEDPRAQRMARRVVQILAQIRADVDLDELNALAQEALVLAAPLYEPSSDVSFASFATRRVHAHIFEAIYGKCLPLLANGRAASLLDDLPVPRQNDSGDATPKQHQERLRRWLLARALSHQLLTLLHSRYADSEDELRRQRLITDVDEAQGELPTNHSKLIRRHYFEGVSLRKLGDELGKSPEAMNRLHQEALLSLRHELVRRGIIKNAPPKFT